MYYERRDKSNKQQADVLLRQDGPGRAASGYFSRQMSIARPIALFTLVGFIVHHTVKKKTASISPLFLHSKAIIDSIQLEPYHTSGDLSL